MVLKLTQEYTAEQLKIINKTIRTIFSNPIVQQLFDERREQYCLPSEEIKWNYDWYQLDNCYPGVIVLQCRLRNAIVAPYTKWVVNVEIDYENGNILSVIVELEIFKSLSCPFASRENLLLFIEKKENKVIPKLPAHGWKEVSIQEEGVIRLIRLIREDREKFYIIL